MPETDPISTQITLIPFQAGERGFVQLGTSPNADLAEWDDYLYLLAHGGVGSGKSLGGAIRSVYYNMVWPGATGIVTAPTFDTMHQSTLPALEQAFRMFGFEEERDWEYNRSREEIYLKPFRSLYYLKSTEKPERLRGQTAAWFWMDEPRDSPIEAFKNLQGRLRQFGYPHQAWCTTTPVGKRHWTYSIFYRSQAAKEGYLELHGLSERTGTARFVAFPARTLDNPFGGAELYRQLVSTYGENSPFVRQELGGEFVLMEGLVYSDWNPEKHIVSSKYWPARPVRIMAGVDFGFTNPSAILVLGLDKWNRRYVMHEYYQPGLSEGELVQEAKRIRTGFGVELFVCDNADPGWIKALRRGGLPARAVKKKTVGTANNPSSGIALCSFSLRRELRTDHIDPRFSRLLLNEENDASNCQMFFLDPSCKNFRMEIEAYVWPEKNIERNLSEVPQKLGDHLMDSWRYAETTAARLWDRDAERQLRESLRGPHNS